MHFVSTLCHRVDFLLNIVLKLCKTSNNLSKMFLPVYQVSDSQKKRTLALVPTSISNNFLQDDLRVTSTLNCLASSAGVKKRSLKKVHFTDKLYY